MWAGISHFKIRDLTGNLSSVRLTRAAQNIKDQPAQRLEPIWRAKGFSLSGHAMVCSLRDSLQGFRGCANAISTDPTNRLSFSTKGRPLWPPESFHCFTCNFSRVTQVTPVCNPRPAYCRTANCDLLRISTTRLWRKETSLWENRAFCGKPHRQRQRESNDWTPNYANASS